MKNEYYQQGVRDYLKGISKCPYAANSPRGESWSMGWYSAQETDEDAYPFNHALEEEDCIDELETE